MRHILLLIPCLLALAVPLYNLEAPRLFGFPFFYWALFLLVPVSALCSSTRRSGSIGRRARRDDATPKPKHLDIVATAVFVFFFALVTVIGFFAGRWRRGDLSDLERMGPGRAALRRRGCLGS